METIQLKPCPFCGGHAEPQEGLHRSVWIECTECGGRSKAFCDDEPFLEGSYGKEEWEMDHDELEEFYDWALALIAKSKVEAAQQWNKRTIEWPFDPEIFKRKPV